MTTGSSGSQVRRKGFNVVLDIRRRLAEVRGAAHRLDAVIAASANSSVEPAAVEELAQLGCRLIELAAALAERDGHP